MDEIVKEVAQKADVSEEVARKTIKVVVELLKEKLPSPLAAQVDGILSGDADVGDIVKGIGGLLGG
ncbi:MAG: DUF2267 domain-containing protein [Chloroflexi bacterium]|nr:DUF2267 domain-containing protein [Chloroflexota bacterium]TDI83809.1 MAG: DUF2267 domain-containing protein [Chloroflexota bacterium]